MTTASAITDSASPTPSRGQGPDAFSADELPTIAELRTIRRAIRGRWKLAEEDRELILEQLLLVLQTANDDKHRVAAAKALIDADKVNVADERNRAPRLHLHAQLLAKPVDQMSEAELEQVLALTAEPAESR